MKKLDGWSLLDPKSVQDIPYQTYVWYIYLYWVDVYEKI